MNGRMPRSSPSTMRRANTRPMRGRFGTGAVGGIHLYYHLIADNSGYVKSMTHLAAAGVGVCRSNLPSGRSVAVVSRFKASSP